jgi:hypothetical protein
VIGLNQNQRSDSSEYAPFGKMAGYAGALYGFIQISGAAVIGTIVSYLPHQNQVALALVFMSTSILAWIVFEKEGFSG